MKLTGENDMLLSDYLEIIIRNPKIAFDESEPKKLEKDRFFSKI